jgi:hypothetical protein
MTPRRAKPLASQIPQVLVLVIMPTLRFGITGNGHAPNYQIECPDGTKHRFRGMGHGEVTDAGGGFAPNNLSTERFSFADVQAMLARLIRKPGL